MKECTRWSNFVMNSTPRVPGGRPLMYIGYKYNYSNVLVFIFTEESRINDPGDTYLSTLPENYFNCSILSVFFPSAIGR